MIPRKIRGVLFDMDGVLLDTERLGRNTFFAECAKRGYTATHELYNSMLGATNEMSRDLTREALGAQFPYDAVMDAFHRSLLDAALNDILPAKPALAECMAGLKERGLLVALATSTARPIVETYIAHTPAMQNVFHAMVCGHEAGRSKPAPDIYLEAARRLGLAPEECLGVEDSLNGLRSLSAAHCPAVMIPDILPCDERFRGLVNYELQSLAQLCPLIDRINLGATMRA